MEISMANNNNQYWSDTLSNDLKAELTESILEADQGRTITHEEALELIADRY